MSNHLSASEPAFQAGYLELARRGELKKRVEAGMESLRHCSNCGWKCGADRLNGELGKCRSGIQARVSSFGPHMGEEDSLRGWRGSGTIFFGRCSLRCQFCQNADISQNESGLAASSEHLAAIMLNLQAEGCHNINLVSPTHVVPQILAALEIAVSHGLTLPLVYNTGGYDTLETLALLEGVVDLYMPDMKYSDAQVAQRYSGIAHYPEVNRQAVREMYRQVGDLYINHQGLACSGLLVRHLLLPNGLAGTREVVQFLADEISRNTYLNLMDQYRPAYHADRFPEINRPITLEEYQIAVQLAHEAGLNRLDRNRLL
jgi:putative pyruvate formate lyase activating enzyme